MDIMFPGLCQSALAKRLAAGLAANGAAWNGLSYPITPQPFYYLKLLF